MVWGYICNEAMLNVVCVCVKLGNEIRTII